MKAYLSVLALSSVLAFSCGVNQASKSSALEESFDARISAAIKAVNANKESEIYSAKGFDAKLFEKAYLEYLTCKGEYNPKSIVPRHWDITRIVDHGKYSAMILNMGFGTEKGEEMQNDQWQVLAVSNDETLPASKDECENIQLTSDDGYKTPRFVQFSSAFPSPKTIRAAFENQPPVERDGMFYAEFTDSDSIMDILKVVYTGTPISQLTIDLAKKPNGKLSWDPTPGRTWSVVNPIYNLEGGGIRVEILDGFADLLDRDYAGTASGANYKLSPWSAGSVRQIMIDGKLVEVLDPKLAKERSPSAPEKEEGGIGTNPVGGGFGTNPVGGGFGIGL